MQNTITLGHLWQVFKNVWWKIVIIVLIAAIVAGTFTLFCVQRKYSSTVEFYIVNVNQSIDYVQSSTLNADQQLSENYIEIIKSDVVMSRVCELLKTNHEIEMTNRQLRKMISSSTNKNASIFSITVTADHPTLAYKIVSYITDLAPEIVTDITKPGELSATVSLNTVASTLAEKAEKNPEKYSEVALAVQEAANKLKENGDSLTVKGTQNRLECIQVLREPVENPNHVSPNLFKVTALSALVAAVLAYAAFFLCDFINTTIRTEEDVKRLTDLPILGTIPRWDTTSKKNAYKASYASKGGK